VGKKVADRFVRILGGWRRGIIESKKKKERDRLFVNFGKRKDPRR